MSRRKLLKTLAQLWLPKLNQRLLSLTKTFFGLITTVVKEALRSDEPKNERFRSSSRRSRYGESSTTESRMAIRSSDTRLKTPPRRLVSLRSPSMTTSSSSDTERSTASISILTKMIKLVLSDHSSRRRRPKTRRERTTMKNNNVLSIQTVG